MAAEAKDGRLRQGFEKHLQETENQVARLEQIGKAILKLTGHTCKAMEGLC